MTLPAFPTLRTDLHVIREQIDGQDAFILSDPYGIQEPVWVTESAFELLRCMDGSRSLDTLFAKAREASGNADLSWDIFEQMLQQFSAMLLLEDRFFHSVYRPVEHFVSAPKRLHVHAGESYPEQKEALEHWIDSIVREAPSMDILEHAVRALVIPHLDLRVEQQAYGVAYQCIQDMEPDRVFLLGTGHSIRDGLFSLSSKTFCSPLGEMPSIPHVVEALREAGGPLCSSHDWAHRNEHALEFQLPFLQRVLKDPQTPIVPILCGSMFSDLTEVERASEIEYMDTFISMLRAHTTPRSLIVAGVDFAHIGGKFGDDTSARTRWKAAHSHDKELLSALCAGDAQRFWMQQRKVNDTFNVCGFSTLALLLEWIPSLRGSVLRHDCWFEDETESAVSFASVVLWDKE